MVRRYLFKYQQISYYQKIRAEGAIIFFNDFIIVGMILLYLKLRLPGCLYNTLNNLRYYLNFGITVIICAAVLLITPTKKKVLFAVMLTLPLNFLIQYQLPNMNYFVRAFWVILTCLLIATEGKISNFSSRKRLFQSSSKSISRLGWTLLASLIIIHFLFH